MHQEPRSSAPIRVRRLGLVAVLAMASLLAIGSACNTNLQTVTVTAHQTSLAKGTSVQLTAVGSFSDGTTGDISSLATWSSANSAVIAVSAAGLASGFAAGQTTISATYKGVTGSINLTITAATLAGISVAPLVAAIAKGTTQTFAATGTFSDGTIQDVTSSAAWSVNQTVATLTTPAPSALTATGIAAGQTPVKAVLMGQTGGATLVVTSATLTALTVMPGTVTLAKGTTAQLRATGTFSDGTTQDLTSLVTWQSASLAVAALSAVPAGLLNAKGTGVALVTASLGAISSPASCTVTAAALVSIAVTPQGPVLAKGTGTQLAATGTFSDGTTQDLTGAVTWTSSQTDVGTVSGDPASAGLVSALTQGATTLTATLMGVSGTAALTVTDASLTSIAVTATGTTPPLGATTQLTAIGTFSDGTTQDLTSTVAWQGSPVGAVQFGPLGQFKAMTPGPASITATLGAVTSDPLDVVINSAALVAIAVTAQLPQIADGTTTNLTALGTYSDGSQLDLTAAAAWTLTTASQSIASVVAPGQIKGLAAGVATVVATDPSTGIDGSAVVSVTNGALESIVVTAVNTTLANGTTTQLTATGTFSDGTTQDLTSMVAWQSLPQGALLIGQYGLLTAQVIGSAGVSAGLGSVISQSLGITVSSATLVSIAVTAPTPQGIQILNGATVQLTATGTYSDGTTQPLTGPAVWATSAPSIASTSSVTPGLVSGVGVGVASITATDQQTGISGAIAISVAPVAPTLVSLAITPFSTYLAPGGTVGFTATGTYSDSSTQDLSSQVTWSSSVPAVATISNAAGSHGLATALAMKGTTSIGAVFNLVSAPLATLVTDPCVNYGGTAQVINANIVVCKTAVTWGAWDSTLIPAPWTPCDLTAWPKYAPAGSPASFGLATLWINDSSCGAGFHREVFVSYPMNDANCYNGTQCCWSDSTVLQFAICSP